MALPDEEIPASASPEANNEWWAALEPAQQDEHLARHPQAIGALDGLPSTARDQGNRAVLDDYIAETQDAHAQLLRDSIGGATGDPRHRSYLLQFQPPSTVEGTDALATVSLGTPETADHTCVFVPGATNNVGKINYRINFVRQLKNEVDIHSDSRATSATIVWLGYNAPDTAIPGALRRKPALEGGERLNTFLRGLATSSTVSNPERSTTVYGHSYGSVVVGSAATGDREFHASRIVIAGSPGMGRHVQSVRDLNVPSDQVFVAAAPDDVVTHAPKIIHGTDPASRGFGARVFGAGQEGHESYFPQGSGGMRNLRNIVTGRLNRVDLVQPRTKSGLAAVMRGTVLRQAVKERATSREQLPRPDNSWHRRIKGSTTRRRPPRT